MSRHIKSIDPNHLVMLGSWGYFGASTFELAEAENPFDLTVHKLTDTVIFSADPICHGEVCPVPFFIVDICLDLLGARAVDEALLVDWLLTR